MAFGDKTKKFQEELAAKTADAAEELAVEQAIATVKAAEPEVDGAAQLASAIVKAINQNTPTRVPYGRHRPTSAFDNKDGSPKPPLIRTCYQNGRLIYDHTVDSIEIELLNMLKPGRFVDGLVFVTVQEDANGAHLHISYKCKTADQRMAIGSRVRNFKGLLRRCIREAMAQEEAEKQRIREMAKSKPKKPTTDILKDDDDELAGFGEDDDYSV